MVAIIANIIDAIRITERSSTFVCFGFNWFEACFLEREPVVSSLFQVQVEVYTHSHMHIPVPVVIGAWLVKAWQVFLDMTKIKIVIGLVIVTSPVRKHSWIL